MRDEAIVSAMRTSIGKFQRHRTEALTLAPVTGATKVLQRTGWPMEEVDLFELNEAFSLKALGVRKELGLDATRVNANGGVEVIGLPLVASGGARVLVTPLHEMQRRGAKKGIGSLCFGTATR